jgi:predicted transcriptional regulator
MKEPRQLIESVAEYFSVSQIDLLSSSQKAEFSWPRKVLIYLLRHRQHHEIANLVKRSRTLVTQYIKEMNYLVDRDEDIRNQLEEIQSQIQNTMTIRLNQSQLKSLHEVLDEFIQKDCESVTEELLVLILDEINEKTRKRIRSGKENLSMDEKQKRVFIIWHFYMSQRYERTHPHAYMTMLDIIQQLKPEKKKILLLN